MTSLDAELTDLMVKAARIEQSVALIRGRGEAGGSHVRVEVDATGRITDLVLDAALRGIPPSDIARLVVEAQHTAHLEARRLADELERELRDDPYAAAIVTRAAAAHLNSVDGSRQPPVRSDGSRSARHGNPAADEDDPPRSWLH